MMLTSSNKFSVISAVFFMLFQTSFAILADDYKPMLVDGRSWGYKHDTGFSWDNGKDEVWYTLHGEIEKDGKSYLKLYRHNNRFDLNAGTSHEIALLREENKRVYMYHPNISDKETMLYGFNLEIGESYQVYPADIYGYHEPEQYPSKVTLDKIDLINDGENEYKAYSYTCIDTDKFGFKTILTISEILGPNWGTIAFPLFSFVPQPTNGSGPDSLYAVIDPDGKMIYHRGGYKVPEEINLGEEYIPTLKDGYTFVYEYDYKDGGNYTHNDFNVGNTPETKGKEICYRVFGTTQIYDKTYFNVCRYTDEFSPDVVKLAAYMREENGRSYIRKGIYRESLSDFDPPEHPVFGYSETKIYDFNLDVGDIYFANTLVLHTLDHPEYDGKCPTIVEKADYVIVNGERRKRIVTGAGEFIEGLGCVRGGTLAFPSLACDPNRKDIRLVSIKDAEGNEIFNYKKDIINGIGTLPAESNSGSVTVYDVSGRKVLSGTEADLSGLQRGVYIIRKGNSSRKVVI